MSSEPTTPDLPLRIGSHQFASRLIVGSGKYDSLETMRDSLAASGAECVTVAVRRERLYDRDGKNILDYIDLKRFTLLPNTAGCYSAEDAIRVARMGREILRRLENPGADWVKLEVLGDSKTLLPRSHGHLGRLQAACCRRLSSPLLHFRRPHHGGSAEERRCDECHARWLTHRFWTRDPESQ